MPFFCSFPLINKVPTLSSHMESLPTTTEASQDTPGSSQMFCLGFFTTWPQTPPRRNVLKQSAARSSVLTSPPPPTQDEQNDAGDRGRRPDHLGVGAGDIHPADRILEGVLAGWDRHPHHACLLFQFVEAVHHWLDRSLRLQRFPLHAGTGWFAIFLLFPFFLLAFCLCVCLEVLEIT